MSIKRWWVSWYHNDAHGPFEIHTPWWWTSNTAVCAAILAPDVEAARKAIYDAYDNPPAFLAWRFVEPRPNDWSPWNLAPGVIGESRFQPRDWMKWPGL